MIESLSEAPGFGRVSTKLLVEPVSIHDMEVRFVRPITVEIFVSRGAMADAVKGILIGAGTDFEAKVKKSLWVVFGVLTFFDRG